jgi:hypothetical protein
MKYNHWINSDSVDPHSAAYLPCVDLATLAQTTRRLTGSVDLEEIRSLAKCIDPETDPRRRRC